jgi:hypothetical protein
MSHQKASFDVFCRRGLSNPQALSPDTTVVVDRELTQSERDLFGVDRSCLICALFTPVVGNAMLAAPR